MLIIPQIFQCAFLTGWEVLRAIITGSFECSQTPEKGRIAKFRISQFRRETTCIAIVLLRKCLQRMFMRAVLRCLCDSLFLPFWRHHRVTPPLKLKFSQHFLIIYHWPHSLHRTPDAHTSALSSSLAPHPFPKLSSALNLYHGYSFGFQATPKM